jgi:anaerobic magnesium-protoporphyrin IX monomethyl ester cyclase
MRILLVNVPHPSIGSRIPDDHLPPLGLLAIGGPLIDAEFGRCRRRKSSPRHSAFIRMPYCSATPARPRAIPLSPKWQAIATAVPRVSIVYGGIFPTYHWR